MKLEHIGIILDGNGRWAERRGRPRWHGHRAGIENAIRIINALAKTNTRYVTLYTFSTENWSRPRNEVERLFGLLMFAAREHIHDLMTRNIRVLHLGRGAKLPRRVVDAIDQVGGLTAGNDGLTVSVALDYGGRQEITEAARRISQLGLAAEEVTEELVAAHLYLPEVPDPDLVIRTGGEHRLSNFLVWQAARSRFHVTDTLWPDFDEVELSRILRQYEDE